MKPSTSRTLSVEPREHRCPGCGAAILWCDGEATPALVYQEEAGKGVNFERRGVPIACERCILPTPKRKAPPMPVEDARRTVREHVERERLDLEVSPDSRPVKQALEEDMRGVIELFQEGAEIAERGAKFLGRLFGK